MQLRQQHLEVGRRGGELVRTGGGDLERVLFRLRGATAITSSGLTWYDGLSTRMPLTVMWRCVTA